MLTITSLYAGILGLICLAISFKAGTLRGKLEIPIGDAGNQDMLLAMRRHANFIEYVPMILILIGLLEMNNVPIWALHILGLTLVVTRVAHALGISADSVSNPGRVVGAAGTALILLITSVWAIVNFF